MNKFEELAQSMALELIKATETAPRDMERARPIEALDHVDVIRRDYEGRKDGHFFSPDAMRFFKSRIDWHQPTYRAGPRAVLFTTSEKGFGDMKRASTVRAYLHHRADVMTVGEFNCHTPGTARKLAKRVAEIVNEKGAVQ
jgi:hypothetical protein